MELLLRNKGVLYLNSSDYSGKDWRLKENCEVYSNRKLCKYEIAADFDNLSSGDWLVIATWFLKHNFLFWLYQSSDSGLHVHFFTKFWSKYHKRKILELIEEDLGIKIDTGPIMRNWIRAEGSKHPVKGNVKKLLYTNVLDESVFGRLFYTNCLSVSTNKKVLSEPAHGPNIIIKDEINEPESIRYMKSHVFANGRKRIAFCLISWWKSREDSNQVIYQKTKDWLRQQNYWMSDHKIWASIYSSTGRVRDRYRLSLLEELGIKLEK